MRGTSSSKRLVRLCLSLSFGTSEDTRAAARIIKGGKEWRAVVDVCISDDGEGDLNALYMARDFLVGGDIEDEVGDILSGVLRVLPGLKPRRVQYAVREEGEAWDGYHEIQDYTEI